MPSSSSAKPILEPRSGFDNTNYLEFELTSPHKIGTAVLKGLRRLPPMAEIEWLIQWLIQWLVLHNPIPYRGTL